MFGIDDMEYLNNAVMRSFLLSWRTMSIIDNFYYGQVDCFTQNGHVHLPYRRYGKD